MKKIFLFIFLIFVFALNVNAEACDAYDIKRLKEIADGVEITYELQEPYEFDGDVIYDRYKIKITGLTDEIYLYDKTHEAKISNKMFNGDIEYISCVNGKISFIVYSNYCPNTLKKMSINLPIYNYYHYGEECKNINYKIKYCDEFLEEYISTDEFYDAYYNYLDLHTKTTKKNNYLYFLILIPIVIVLILFVLWKKRKVELK